MVLFHVFTDNVQGLSSKHVPHNEIATAQGDLNLAQG